MADPLPILVDDLNQAFDELVAVAAGDEQSVRRKFNAYQDALYTLRNYRSAQLKTAARKQIWEPLVRKGHVMGGQQVEGHVVARNNKVHHMIKMAPPATAPTYPGDRLTPSDYLYPGENLTWMRLDELDQRTRRAVSDADKDGYFKNLLGGLPVLPTADIARRCLVGWAGFGRLSDATYMASLRSAALSP